MQRFAIIGEKPGWHGKQLRRALRKRGCDPRFVSLRQCGYDLEADRVPLRVQGFDGELPAGVFVRCIPGGSFEEVTFWLDILHAMRELGVPVYNDARAIERSVDKAMTSFLLRQGGIATPPCRVFSDLSLARQHVERERAAGHETVYKPLFGSQGGGLLRIGEPGQLPDPQGARGVYYLQRFVGRDGGPFCDWRVFVAGGRAVAAMQRRAPVWITNVARGGQCLPAVLNEPLARLACRAAARLGLSYAGVDIIGDAEQDYQVIEVNSIPAWRGLQSVCPVNIADRLIEDFLTFCRGERCVDVVG